MKEKSKIKSDQEGGGGLIAYMIIREFESRR